MAETQNANPASAEIDALERTATALLEADAAADQYAKKTRREEWDAAEYRRRCDRVRELQRDFSVVCTPELILTLITAARPVAEEASHA